MGFYNLQVKNVFIPTIEARKENCVKDTPSSMYIPRKHLASVPVTQNSKPTYKVHIYCR